MTVFSIDGKYAYICSSFTPSTVVVDTQTRETVATIPQYSAFCPNIAASPDGRQVWFTLKDTGKVQVSTQFSHGCRERESQPNRGFTGYCFLSAAMYG